jgi:rSAM/selenodomain-associated transferase 1
VQERLVVFTRYPEPGKAKTRLIPALGELGAAELHRQMAEHTLMQVRGLQAVRNLSVEVRFAGGDFAQMQGWLGADLNYQMQGEGDLGDRLFHACQVTFNNGNDSVVMIGTDCPDLDTALLQKAFQELRQHDLVLGPATDGGYYLIGLRRPVPQLFTGIAWSTAEVLQQTVAIAKRLGLAIAYLPTLSDIDHPEDLDIWQGGKGNWG